MKESTTIKVKPRWRSAIDPVWGGLRAVGEGYRPRLWSEEGMRWPQRLGLGAQRRQIETSLGVAQYVEVGSGSPVIFLHGLDGSSRWWAPTLAALAGQFRCLALEFVRFERWRESARVPLPRTGEFVATWLAALGIERADVIGHSMGGYTASQVAIDHPERVGKLALIAPAVLPISAEYIRNLARVAPFLGTIAPGFAPTLLVDSLRTGPLRWVRSTLELTRAQPLALERIAAPTLLLWGKYDPLVPSTNGPIVRDRIPDARLIILPTARHVPMYESPVACNTVLSDFLAGNAQPESEVAAIAALADEAPPQQG